MSDQEFKLLWSDEVDIPYEDYRKLHFEGKCNLGIPDSLAEQITQIKGALPKSSGTRYAFAFYNLLGFACLGYSIYLSFTWNWWAFIVGFFIAAGIFNINKKSNSENVLNDALNDKNFYEELRHLKGLQYQIDESVADQYLIGR